MTVIFAHEQSSVRQISDAITQLGESFMQQMDEPYVRALLNCYQAHRLFSPVEIMDRMIAAGTPHDHIPMCIIDDLADMNRAQEMYGGDSLKRLIFKAIAIQYELSLHLRTKIWV